MAARAEVDQERRQPKPSIVLHCILEPSNPRRIGRYRRVFGIDHATALLDDFLVLGGREKKALRAELPGVPNAEQDSRKPDRRRHKAQRIGP